MLRIPAASMPCPAKQLRQALNAYLEEKLDHQLTTGVPAPWPAFDIIFQIVDAGGDFVVIPEPSPAVPPVKPLFNHLP